MDNNKPLIISIFGKPGVGKSTLAGALEEKLDPDADRIRGDNYLKSRGELSFDEYFSQSDNFDWPLLHTQLQQPIGSVIETPIFDFENFQRISERGNNPFIISKYLVIDAVQIFPFADVFVELTLADEIRKQRLETRYRPGIAWRERFLAAHTTFDQEKSINQNFENVSTVLDTRKSIPDLVDAVMELIEMSSKHN